MTSTNTPSPAAVSTLARECDRPTAALRERLDAFYAATSTYQAFQEASDHPALWAHVAAEIERLFGERDRASDARVVRVLELGAGCTGFGDFLQKRPRRERVHLTVQDVTAQNRAHLERQADAVHIGPIQTLPENERFDVIFSTFVFEHVTDPAATLRRCEALLAPGGSLFIFCPRYDLPFYLPPSACHYGVPAQLGLALATLGARLRTLITGQPAFLIHHDPALFTQGFARDRDAVHWVSRWDLGAWFRGRAEMSDLPVPAGPGKDWIVKNLLQVHLRIRPRAAAAPPDA